MTSTGKTEMQKAMVRLNALAARYRQARTLIVEDSAEARGMLRGFMREAGSEKIDLASSGQEAIECMKRHKYDIVLCDYNLGKGKDGQQVLEEARLSKYLSYNTVFMMITAETTLELVMGALEYQPDNYLSKPFTRNDLTRRLDRALSIKLEYKAIESAFEREDYEKTLELCHQKLAEGGGSHFRALRVRGESLLALKRFKEAKDLYSAVLEEREVAWAKIGLGRVLYRLKAFDEAAEIFNKLIDEQPNVVESYDWLAKIQIALGEARVAQDTLEAAVNRSPKAILRQVELARVAMLNRSFLVAEKAYRKAIMLAVDSCYHSPDHYLQYVRSLLVKIDGAGSKLETEAFKEAQLFLARVRKEFPNQPVVEVKVNLLEALVTHGHLQFEISKRFIARGEMRLKEFSIGPQIALADEYVGTLAQVGMFDEAEAFVHELQKSADKPDLANRLRKQIVDGKVRVQSDALNTEAMALLERGQIMEAQGKFQQAARAEGASPNLLLNAARACLDLAEREDLNQLQWREECQTYLTRLSGLDCRDHRHEQYAELQGRLATL
ncbi:MAG: CheY-like chemotaxis protein [Litorivivens sp.]|jgi:CheY-like chemotaxis protein